MIFISPGSSGEYYKVTVTITGAGNITIGNPANPNQPLGNNGKVYLGGNSLSVPTTEDDPTKDDPTKDDPTEDDPTKDDPTEDDPTKDDPTKDDPTKDDPTEDDPTKDDPTEDDPTEDDPTEDDPTEDDPTGPTDSGYDSGDYTGGETLETVNIPSLPVPLAAAVSNETDDAIEIGDEDVPLAEYPGEELMIIEDEDVPLSEMPQTGADDAMLLWILGLCGALSMTGASALLLRKQRQR